MFLDMGFHPSKLDALWAGPKLVELTSAHLGLKQ
jgi:hypothetical protein